MPISLHAATCVTPPTASHWAGSVTEDKFFILVEVRGVPGDPASDIGPKILEMLFADLSNRAALSHRELAEVLSKLKANPAVLAALVGRVEGHHLSISGIGEAVVIIQRQGKQGVLLSGTDTIRGQLQEGDRVLLYSKRFEACLSDDDRHLLLTAASLEEAVATITPRLFEQDACVGCGLLVLGAGDGVVTTSDTNEEQDSTPEPRQARIPIISLPRFHQTLRLPHLHPSISLPAFSKKTRTIASLAAILFILGAVGLYIFAMHKRDAQKAAELTRVLGIATQQYDEANSLIELNPLRARSLLADAKGQLTPLLVSFPKKSQEYQDLTGWIEKVTTAQIAANRVYTLRDVPVYFDVTLIKPSGVATKIASFRKTKVILDTTTQTLYSIKTDTKQTHVLAGADIVKDAKHVAIHGAYAYIINTDGIVSIDIGTRQVRVVIPHDPEWGTIEGIAAFTGNLYLLDSSQSVVWKYIATEDGFTQKRPYTPEGTGVSFSDSTDIAIDGVAWLVMPSSILKYTGGVRDPYELKGFIDDAYTFAKISTSDEEKYLYVLDRVHSRISVFDKEGLYQYQYQWDALKDATDLVATESEGNLYVLIGSKIYTLDIK